MNDTVFMLNNHALFLPLNDKDEIAGKVFIKGKSQWKRSIIAMSIQLCSCFNIFPVNEFSKRQQILRNQFIILLLITFVTHENAAQRKVLRFSMKT